MKNLMLACRNPSGTHWQLGRLSTAKGNLTLIGWRVAPTPVDAGVPAAVAEILARAMTSAARVIFPCSSIGQNASTAAWQPNGEDMTRKLTSGGSGLIERVWSNLAGAPSEVTIISTRRPETAARLFDDAAYPWWMQGQIALLCEPERAAPDIDRQKLFGLFEDDWTRRAASLEAAGVCGVLRPGADGDLAGLLSLNDKFRDNFLALAESECRSAGFDWMLLPENDFAQRLAETD